MADMKHDPWENREALLGGDGTLENIFSMGSQQMRMGREWRTECGQGEHYNFLYLSPSTGREMVVTDSSFPIRK